MTKRQIADILIDYKNGELELSEAINEMIKLFEIEEDIEDGFACMPYISVFNEVLNN